MYDVKSSTKIKYFITSFKLHPIDLVERTKESSDINLEKTDFLGDSSEDRQDWVAKLGLVLPQSVIEIQVVDAALTFQW